MSKAVKGSENKSILHFMVLFNLERVRYKTSKIKSFKISYFKIKKGWLKKNYMTKYEILAFYDFFFISLMEKNTFFFKRVSMYCINLPGMHDGLRGGQWRRSKW